MKHNGGRMTIATLPKRLGFFTRLLDQADPAERYRHLRHLRGGASGAEQHDAGRTDRDPAGGAGEISRIV